MLESGLRWPYRGRRRFRVPSFHGQKQHNIKKKSSGSLFTCLSNMNRMWFWSKITKKTKIENKGSLRFVGFDDDQRYKSREQGGEWRRQRR